MWRVRACTPIAPCSILATRELKRSSFDEKMKYLSTALTLATLLLTCSCAHLSQSEKVERFRKRSGITSLSDETCQRLDLHLSRRSDGIHRVVVPLRPAEADALQGTDRPGDWVPGPIPEPIWKATVMMGDTRQPPDKFIPVYTNQLKYVYREVGANFHIYILDTTDSKEPILYYVYYNLQ
jgi:hypothetical protein